MKFVHIIEILQYDYHSYVQSCTNLQHICQIYNTTQHNTTQHITTQQKSKQKQNKTKQNRPQQDLGIKGNIQENADKVSKSLSLLFIETQIYVSAVILNLSTYLNENIIDFHLTNVK